MQPLLCSAQREQVQSPGKCRWVTNKIVLSTKDDNLQIFLVRGLPGSGKTTLAWQLPVALVISADDYFYQSGCYVFDPEKLGEAHAACQERYKAAIQAGESVAVANTFSQQWEAQPYFDMAREADLSVTVIECQNNFGSIHGVSEETIRAMMERWEPLVP